MRRLTAGVALWAALLAGCNKTEPFGKVGGAVTFEGKPVETAVVLFSNPQLGVEMTTFTDRDGKFEIHTAQVGGLPIGDYKIAITPYVTDMPTNGIEFTKKPSKEFPNIPMPYRDIATSGLTATVNTGDNNFQFEMKSTALK